MINTTFSFIIGCLVYNVKRIAIKTAYKFHVNIKGPTTNARKIGKIIGLFLVVYNCIAINNIFGRG